MCDPLAGEAAQPQKKVPRVGDGKVGDRSSAADLTTDLWISPFGNLGNRTSTGISSEEMKSWKLNTSVFFGGILRTPKQWGYAPVEAPVEIFPSSGHLFRADDGCNMRIKMAC